MHVSAQVSLYPLGQGDVRPAIEAAWRAFDSQGLAYQPGSMSTLVSGDVASVFAALRGAFDAAAQHGGVVLVVTVSNACPPLGSR
jgi:uncharacterized protein YqgV (UPF0045/DUF77 family)